RRGFQHHELSLLQVWLNRGGCLLDVTQVRVSALVQRSWHANDNGVHFLQALEIRRGRKMPAVDELLNLCLRDMLDVRPARIEHIHFVWVRVESRTLVPSFRETKR